MGLKDRIMNVFDSRMERALESQKEISGWSGGDRDAVRTEQPREDPNAKRQREPADAVRTAAMESMAVEWARSVRQGIDSDVAEARAAGRVTEFNRQLLGSTIDLAVLRAVVNAVTDGVEVSQVVSRRIEVAQQREDCGVKV